MPKPSPLKNRVARDAATTYRKVPTRGKEEDPRTYTKNPHDYGDVLLKPEQKTGRQKLSGALQRDLVYWISRHTWGANTSKVAGVVTRPEWAKLSLGILMQLCGVSERKTVARAIADLVERGIVEARERKGCGPTTAKMYKLTPDRWAAAPYHEPKPDPDDDPEIEAERDAYDEHVRQQDELADTESTVEPGRSHRPQALSIQTGKDAPTVTIRVVYRNECNVPLTFRSRTGRNGRVQVTAKFHQTGESKANVCSHTGLQSFASSSPTNKATKDFSEYEAFVNRLVLDVWGKKADEQLIAAIVRNAKGAPVDTFQNIVFRKIKGRDAATRHSPGLLPELATDAHRAHEAYKAAQRIAPQPAPLLSPEERAAEDAAFTRELGCSLEEHNRRAATQIRRAQVQEKGGRK
jgi:hypothetical protein